MTPLSLSLAESFAERFIEQIDSSTDIPNSIVLATYETQLDYEILRPEDKPTSVQDHREMINYIKTLLDQEFGGTPQITITTVNASQYLRWLAANKLTNDAGNRALFVSIPPRNDTFG